MCHCLRKQQSRLVPAQAGIQAIGTSPTFWTAALAAVTPLSRPGRTPGRPLPAVGEASCFVRLKCYKDFFRHGRCYG